MKRFIIKDLEHSYLIEAKSQEEAFDKYNEIKQNEFSLEELFGTDYSDII